MKNIEPNISYGELAQDAKKIYSYFEDNISKKIFVIRWGGIVSTENLLPLKGLFSEPKQSISDYASMYSYDQHISNTKFTEGETVILYGAGRNGENFLNLLAYLRTPYDESFFDKVDFIFCDRNYKNIKECAGKPVISPEELFTTYSQCKVIILTAVYHNEVYQFLADNNFDKKNLCYARVIYDLENQYFDNEIIKFSDDEVFVDAGVYDADTSVRFANKCNGNYKKIYLFEPDIHFHKISMNTLKEYNMKKCELYNLGLWNKKDMLRFSDSGCPRIQEDGLLEINVDSLDNILGDTEITFLKMDIEGAELNALIGAKKIIKKYKPKLAISIYHKPEDILEIPAYIKSLVPEYKLFLRHYSNIPSETILYAIY